MKQCDNQQSIDEFTKIGVDTSRIMLDALGEFVRAASSAIPNLSIRNKSCCDIPPACWLPRNFGTFESRACPCGTALLRVRVENCQPVAGTIVIKVKQDDDLEIVITPQSVTLGPMERKWVTVRVTVPDDACKGKEFDLLVWVSGCNEHYARWTVQVADGASGTCIQARVEDCPDYVHHWYDHFYCARPCFSQTRTDQRQ